MEYYIQGNSERAEEIKAAFEAKGIDTTAINVDDEDFLYFSSNGLLYFEEFSNTLLKIFKTHQDYKELELPVECEFKAGDWIFRKNGSSDIPIQVYGLKNDRYLVTNMLGTKGEVMLTCQDKWHLWTIQDAKDGDVLVTTKIRSCPFIYRKTSYKNNLAYYYAGIDGNGDFCEGYIKRTLSNFGPVADVIPATKEQRDQLLAKMKEAGYTWDEKKKELRRIQPHYDIANFKPFDKVLVRDRDERKWGNTYFGFYDEEQKVFVCDCYEWEQCIPFEGNEALLGTTDMPSDEFINW